MRKKEQRLWDMMKRRAPKTAWLQRVENIVAEGMPDVHVSGPESECWVELKAVTLPRRETTRVLGTEGLRPSQINWHLKAGTKSIRSYILIRDDVGMLYLIEGRHAASVNEWPMAKLEERNIGWGWDNIYQELMGWERPLNKEEKKTRAELALTLLRTPKQIKDPDFGALNVAGLRGIHALMAVHLQDILEIPSGELDSLVHSHLCNELGDGNYCDWLNRIKADLNIDHKGRF